jgi:hypothetical protein
MPFTINGTTGINLGTQPLTGSLPDANAPSGSVIQVVQQTITGTVSSSSTSYVATGLIASITPTSASNRILVILSGGTTTYDGSGGTLLTRIFRQIAGGSYNAIGGVGGHNLTGSSYGYPHSLCYLDSPNTTGVVNYQPYFQSSTGNNLYFNYQPTGGVASLTLMEISA